MGLLKDVLAKLTVFTKIDDALVMKQYINDCVNDGSKAFLYKNPKIATSFYAEGTQAAENIQTAIDNFAAIPTTTNESAIVDSIAAAVVWLKKYAKQVEPIANSDLNRDTREEAATNIKASKLTPQKLANARIGDAETPVITGEDIGGAKIYIKIVNGATYNPRNTMFMAVRLPEFTTKETPDPVVTLVKGQIRIVTVGNCETITLTVSGKGRFATLTASETGSRWAIYAYAQNGKKQVSKLATRIIVKL